MGQIQESICQHTKECCRIIATTSLSLLLPISFLFIARHDNNNYYNSPQFFLTLFTFLFSIAALVHGLTNGRVAIFSAINQSRFAAWVLLFLIEVPCLYLWINAGTINSYCSHGSKFQSSSFVFAESETKTFQYFSRRSLEILIHDHSTKRSSISFLLRRVVLFVGLQETMVLWCRSVVAHVVDEGISGFNDREDLKWIEQVVLAVAYCCLWWWRVREDAETMVVCDHVVGWFYYLTAAIGVVKVVRSLVWLTTWVYRYMLLAYKRGTLYVSLLD